MTIEDIRALRNAEPFQPFTIRMKDGRRFGVPHFAFVGIADWAGCVTVAAGRSFETFPAKEIDGVEMGADDTLFRKLLKKVGAS
jgi:hypothetical protein